MKLVSLGHDKAFNLLLQFLGFIELYIQKPFALYQLEAVPFPIKDNNTEANSYTWLQPRKDYLAMIEDNYIRKYYKLLKQSKLIKLFLTSFCCLHAKASSSGLTEMLD